MMRRDVLVRTGKRWAALATPLSLAAALTVSPLAHAEEIAGLAKRLSDLRGEVETLSDQLSSRKNDVQEQLRSFARQKSELELEIQREETRTQKLRQAVEQKREENETLQSANQSLAPAFEKQVSLVRGYVSESLPFRQKERLAEIEKIEEQFKSGLLPAQRALNRLWSFVEDELRMTRENGLFSQPVLVDGREQLADVVRIGMVALYFRTPADDFGTSVFENGEWSFRTVADEEQKKSIRKLFETFKKQIRVGYFELPNALPKARSAER